MSRVAYVNGAYVPFADAGVHIEDRGYQFADGVYEVMAFEGAHLVDEQGHFDRLERSLGELQIAMPMSRRALVHTAHEIVRRNRISRGIVYIQVSRGVAKRDHAFPSKFVPPSVVMTVRRINPVSPAVIEKGVSVISLPDIRWGRCDIKSVSLLPNVLAKETAKRNGAYEAWLVDEKGMVTEGCSTNAWIITRDGTLVTYPLAHEILGGVTRKGVIEIAKKTGVKVEERPFSLEEAKTAQEAFVTSTTSIILPVISVDGQKIGEGKPGATSLKLRQAYADNLAAARG